MGKSKFSIGTRFLFNGHVFLIKKRLTNRRFELENLSFGGVDIKTLDELASEWEKGNLIFEVDGPNTILSSSAKIKTDYSFADFESLPKRDQLEAWWKYCVIYPLLRLPKKKRTRSNIKTYVENYKPDTNPILNGVDEEVRLLVLKKKIPSYFTVQRWLNGFIKSGYDIRSLVSMNRLRGGVGKSKIHPDVENIIDSILKECVKDNQKHSIRGIHKKIVHLVDILNDGRPKNNEYKIPGERAIGRRINAHPLKTAILGRKKSRVEIEEDSSVYPAPKLTRILERVEIDHTDINLIVVDDNDRFPIGRPTLTFAIDAYSRMPFGFYVGFEPKSYLTVMACLYHGIMPKPDVKTIYETENVWPVWGMPETLFVDNGKEFIGRDLKDACAQLGIHLEQAPLMTAWFKGKVERFFRTLSDELLDELPGATDSNPVERGDYDSMKFACISESAFIQMLHIFLLDDYAQDWHEGIEEVPSKKWNASYHDGFEPYLSRSAEELRILLFRTEERVIQRNGIEFESIVYQNDELVRMRSALFPEERSIKIKYNPNDLGEICVLDTTGEQDCWITIPALEQAYAKGLSLRKHQIIRSLVLSEKHKVNILDLAAAKARINQIVKEEYEKTKKRRSRKHLANLIDNDSSSDKAENLKPSQTQETFSDSNDSTLDKNGQLNQNQNHNSKIFPDIDEISSEEEKKEDDDTLWGASFDLPVS